MTYTTNEMMTVAAARRLKNGSVCFVGIGLPSKAANLARLTSSPDVVLIYESGAVESRPDRLPLSIGDGVLAESALTVVSVPEVFDYWLQPGRIDVGFLSGAQLADPVVQAEQLVRRGRVSAVVVGLGSGGALGVERGGRVIRQTPPRLDLQIVDTNGAGDSLAVGFLDAFALDGLGLDAALHRGQVCARWACSRIGSDGLLTRDELAALG